VVKELIPSDGCDPKEIVDCLLLVVDGAARAGIDLPQALRAKLEKNRQRTWGEPDERGVREHVRADKV
jgi:dATP/dGTP diphosphohydrolase